MPFKMEQSRHAVSVTVGARTASQIVSITVPRGGDGVENAWK